MRDLENEDKEFTEAVALDIGNFFDGMVGAITPMVTGRVREGMELDEALERTIKCLLAGAQRAGSAWEVRLRAWRERMNTDATVALVVSAMRRQEAVQDRFQN